MLKGVKDKHTLEIAQKKIGKNNNLKMNITNMLQEFQILPSMFGFAFGISFHDFLKKFKINSDLLSSFIILLSIFIILYLFIYFIFYRFIYLLIAEIRQKTYILLLDKKYK